MYIVASFQVGQAIKILLKDGSYNKELLYIDAWEPLLERLAMKSPEKGCRICEARTATVINKKGLPGIVGVEPSGGETQLKPQLQVVLARPE